MDAGTLKLYSETWQELRGCIRKTDSLRAESPSKTASMKWANEVLWRLLTQDRKLHQAVKDAEVRATIERAHDLLEIFTGTTLDPLVVRLFPPPRQTVTPSVVTELRVASEVERKWLSLLGDIGKGTVKPMDSQDALVGCLLLALIFDCGVLDAAELTEALRVIWSDRPVRAALDAYYLWITLNETGSGIARERRRLFLTPVAAALAMAITPVSGTTPPKLKVALKAICKLMGIPGASIPGLKSLMRGTAARLRFAANVPQFVVDYAERRISSHAVTESAYRRIVGLAPWSDALATDDMASPEGSHPVAEQPDASPSCSSSKSSFCSAIVRVLERSADAASIGAAIEQLKATMPPATAIEGLLCDWVLALLPETSSKGVPRRPGTVRNMLTAIGPRLVAAAGTIPLSDLSGDDWKAIHEGIMEEKRSGSRNGTIYSSLNHLLNWMVSTGKLSELPIEISPTGEPSTVNATLVTPEEFEQLAAILMDDLSLESTADREFQLLVGEMGQHGAARRGESRGLMKSDLHLQSAASADFVDNAARRLKTESSPRRIPLTLMSSTRLPDLAARLLAMDPEESRLVSARRLSVDEENLLRRLSKKLADVTGDPDVSIHTLRHSAATWILLILYADDLQLARFIKQWPFLKALLPHAKQVRETLLASYGSVHGLHAIRQLLGHRHEEMSLQHYIHALDWLRFAAVTLVTGDRGKNVIVGAAGVSSSTVQTSKRSVGAIVRALEARHAGRVRREDVKNFHRSSHPSSAPSAGRELYQTWLDRSAQLADPTHANPEAAAKHAQLVALINKQRAVSKAKKRANGVRVLDEIRPNCDADKKLAIGVAQWVATTRREPDDLACFAETMIAAHTQRGLGRFGCAMTAAEALLDPLVELGGIAGFNVSLSTEKRVKNDEGKDRRVPESIPRLPAPAKRGRGKVFWTLSLSGSAEREAIPLQALIWALAMAALSHSKSVTSENGN